MTHGLDEHSISISLPSHLEQLQRENDRLTDQLSMYMRESSALKKQLRRSEREEKEGTVKEVAGHNQQVELLKIEINTLKGQAELEGDKAKKMMAIVKDNDCLIESLKVGYYLFYVAVDLGFLYGCSG